MFVCHMKLGEKCDNKISPGSRGHATIKWRKYHVAEDKKP